MHSTPITLQAFIKRVFDLTMAILSLPFLIPVIIIIGVLIKIESVGPVVYALERIGKDRKPFRYLKFRTMYVNAEERLAQLLTSNADAKLEWDKYWKLNNDPRVTKIGAFLRKTSLDELPQIFNVLMGVMSFVGPRPLLSYEADHLEDWQKERFSCKPGLTGLAQVNFKKITNIEEMIKIDLEYIEKQSLCLDIMILLRTVSIVVRKEGGY